MCALTPLTAAVRAAAEQVFAYLSEIDPLPATAADAVVGFGMFDLTLPRFCADLYTSGAARQIIFTGGIGAGTGNLGGPEADVWRAEIRRTHPEIPDDAIIIENRSTNTAENIGHTAALLNRAYPALAFGQGIKSAIIVASPSRLRRVRLTLWKLQPQVRVVRRLPPVSFGAEQSLYERQGVRYIDHLIGELDRLQTYPERGWIAHEPLPAAITVARDVLRQSK